MTNNLYEAAASYNRALDLYEHVHAQKNNLNRVTAVPNLKANVRRQRMPQKQSSQQQAQKS